MNNANQTWWMWAYGKELVDFTDAELRREAQIAWNIPDIDRLQAFRAEAARRGIRVA